MMQAMEPRSDNTTRGSVGDAVTNNHLQIHNPQIVVIGDRSSIGTCRNEGDLNTFTENNGVELSRLSRLQAILPMKPYHKCKERKHQLQEMAATFESMTSSSAEQVVSTLFLTGPPGSGKTQLARQFAEMFLKTQPWCSGNAPIVFTLDVVSIESLLQSVQDIVRQFSQKKHQYSDKMDLVQSYLIELRDFLRRYNGKWLLILDNMRCDNEANSVLPSPGSSDWGCGKVIVTSQDNRLVIVGSQYAKLYSLEPMTGEDANDLLQQISGANVDRFTHEVAKELGYFPLSLACAATYVAQMRQDRPSANFSWKQFLDNYRELRENVRYQTYVKNNATYPYSMAHTTRLAVQTMSQSSSVLRLSFHFLSYCSLNPVPLHTVSEYVKMNMEEGCSDPEEIKGEISRCSLLVHGCSGSTSVETISTHRIVHDVLKQCTAEEDAKPSECEKRGRFVNVMKCMDRTLKMALKDAFRAENVDFQILMSPHFDLFVAYSKSEGWNVCEQFVEMSVSVATSLYHVSGVTDKQRLQYLEDAHLVAKQLPTLDRAIHCRLLAELGFYYRELHRLEESEQVLLQALNLIEFEDGRSLKSQIFRYLSWTYKLLRKFEDAAKAMEESINIAKETHSPDVEPEIALRLCELAFVYCDLHQTHEAKNKVDEARRIVDKHTRGDLKRAAVFRDSAKIYLYCAYGEEPGKAKELFKMSYDSHVKALEMYEEVYLTKEHLDVAGVLITYAAVCRELSDCRRAMELIDRAEKIYTRIQHDIGLSFALSYKAEILFARGNTQDAHSVLSNYSGAKFLYASHILMRKKQFSAARKLLNEFLTDHDKSGKSPPSPRWLEQARTFLTECDREILVAYRSVLVNKYICPVACILFIAVVIGILYSQ